MATALAKAVAADILKEHQKRTAVEMLNQASADGQTRFAPGVPIEFAEAAGERAYIRLPGWHWCLQDRRGLVLDMEVPW